MSGESFKHIKYKSSKTCYDGKANDLLKLPHDTVFRIAGELHVEITLRSFQRQYEIFFLMMRFRFRNFTIFAATGY